MLFVHLVFFFYRLGFFYLFFFFFSSRRRHTRFKCDLEFRRVLFRSAQLATGTGGFVFATTDTTIQISFPGQTVSGGRTTQINFGPIDSESWLVNLSATTGEIKSPIGGVGMNPESSNSYDGLDEFSPPRFIDYVEFNFNHPEYFYHSFGRDVATTADEHVWEFDVETNQTGLTTLS